MNSSIDMDPLNPYEYHCGYNANMQPPFNYDPKVTQHYGPNSYQYGPLLLNLNAGLNEPMAQDGVLLQNKNVNNFLPNDKNLTQAPPNTSESIISNTISNITNSTLSNNGAINTEMLNSNVKKGKKATSDISKKMTVKKEEKSDIKNEDSKEDLKPLLNKKKPKGKVSSYWNKKIEDKDFAFYGCTICNISFKTIPELDNHVTIHKGRLTSYDLRLKNQKKKKLLKKQQKQMKKLGKTLKKEDVKTELAVEIKPEEGYIGNEVASEYTKSMENNTETTDSQGNCLENTKTSDNNNESTDNNSKVKKGKSKENANDPRLEKLFKCFACQKQFALSYYLKLHVRSHTDERPYTCAECGMSFITASKLGRHTKRIHLSVRYTCRICYRYFSRFEYLTRHFDKKHADDKIEGEPYDYNVILPYLKELEEELREKSEKENELKTEDGKDKVKTNSSSNELPKPEEDKTSPDLLPTLAADTQELKQEIKQEPSEIYCEREQQLYGDLVCKSENDTVNGNITVEAVKESYVTENVILLDTAKDSFAAEGDDNQETDFQDGGGRDDNFSDEDYFPSNTWAATPKMDPDEPQTKPEPKKKKRGRKRKAVFPRQCELCTTVLTTKYFMKTHMATHSGQRPYICDLCKKGFITKSKLCRHLLTHETGDEIKTEIEEPQLNEDGEVKCEEKKKTKRTKKAKKLKKLISSSSKEVEGFKKRGDFAKRPYVCMYCHQRFLHRDTMVMHRKLHKNESFKCYYCLESMSDEATLTRHEDTHTGPKPYVCNECGRSYRRREAMLTHKKSHDPTQKGKEKKEFICDICSKSYNAACKLQRHLMSHRADKFILKYECPVCAYMFNTKYHIEMHLTTHMKEGLIFEENRSEILAMVLQNARRFPKSSNTSVNLTDLIPADERSRVCNICGEVFQHFYYLEEHLKSHGSKIAIADETQTEEKKHICPVCNKGFKLHYYLKLHSFTHSKEKPFICQHCGKGFITKGKLKRHLETHTGLKKYQCHICCKFFTRPSYLRVHIRTIHGTQDFNFRLK